MPTPFPVTATDEVLPGDPKLERSRLEIALAPEDLTARIMRTRRYFRLTRRSPKVTYAKGLDSKPEDMA